MLTAQQYILRCSLVVAIILGTMYSLSQDEFMSTLLDQKLLVLLTMASSIAVDQFYGFSAPSINQGVKLSNLEAPHAVEGTGSTLKMTDGRIISATATLSMPSKSPFRQPEEKWPSSKCKISAVSTPDYPESTLPESEENVEQNIGPPARKTFGDKMRYTLALKEILEDQSLETDNETWGGKSTATALPSHLRDSCKKDRVPASEDQTTHFSVPPAAFNEHQDHQCLHVHLKEPAKLHIVPNKGKKDTKQAKVGKEVSSKKQKYVPDPAVDVVDFKTTLPVVNSPVSTGSMGNSSLKPLEGHQQMLSFLGSMCVVGSLALLEEHYSVFSLLSIAGGKYFDKPVLASFSVAVPFILYCLTFLDNTNSGFSASHTLVLPTDKIRKRKTTGKPSKRDSACTCVSQTGLIYLGVLCIVLLAFLGFMMEYFPRRPPPPKKFYETCTGQLLIVTVFLLLISLGVIVYLCKRKTPQSKATKSTASGTGKIKRPQKNFSYADASVHTKLEWSPHSPCLMSCKK